jgi:hypothetical protein
MKEKGRRKGGSYTLLTSFMGRPSMMKKNVGNFM